MVSIDERKNAPWLTAVAVIAVMMSGLFVGYEPALGDPDCLYRPIKTELAAALSRGTLPFWSDHFGLGMPLAAESHSASFYPPNWIAYRVLSVSAAYRLMMWIHYVALALATFAYARCLDIKPWGAALTAIAFTLCGFQTSHSAHEPFYHILPYLPLTLLLTERFLAGGSRAWLAGLALALGAQFTLGHFQIQMWTAALVVLTAIVRTRPTLKKRRTLKSLVNGRVLAIMLAVALAAAIASPQLGITFELTRNSNFSRAPRFLTNYSLPPAHWAQLILPSLFYEFIDSTNSPYWNNHHTTFDETCFYVGTIPFIFAIVGLTHRGDKALGYWKWIAVIAFAMATMVYWWPEAFMLILKLPGLGHFRAPGRYTLLISFALCLLAGRGFDSAVESSKFRLGLATALVVALGGFAWGFVWSGRPDVLPYLGDKLRLHSFALAGVSWLLAIATVLLWRSERLPRWAVCLAVAGELGFLYYYQRPPLWKWSIDIAAESPVLKSLKAEEHVDLIAGKLQDLPVWAGLTAAYPNLGIVPPPPNYLIEPSTFPVLPKPETVNLYNRFGISHGVFEGPRPFRPSRLLYLGEDKVLDSRLPSTIATKFPRLWRVERYLPTFPQARVARKVRVAKDWIEMFPPLVKTKDADEVWYMNQDKPPEGPGPRATQATIAQWDGRGGIVEHDGDCDLVIRRTFYPGWTATINGGPPIPLRPADGGLQALRLTGKGPTRVETRYTPTRLSLYIKISAAALVVALSLIALELIGKRPSKSVAS